MRRIYKYPMGHEALTINCVKVVRIGSDGSHDVPTIWVEHDRDPSNESTWKFHFFGTGHDIPDSAGDHVGSCRCGHYIWHVYGKAIVE